MKFALEKNIHGTRWDAIGLGDGFVATVELKFFAGKGMSDWWVSGLNADEELVALARMSFGLGVKTQAEALPLLEPLYRDVLRETLMAIVKLGGFSEAPNTGSNENRLALCRAHLDGHEELGTIGPTQPLRVDTARQFQLIKSFGYSTAQKLISERSGLPRSTVDRRLFLARESGLLQKMSDVEDIKN